MLVEVDAVSIYDTYDYTVRKAYVDALSVRVLIIEKVKDQELVMIDTGGVAVYSTETIEAVAKKIEAALEG